MNQKTLINTIQNGTASFRGLSGFENQILRLAVIAIGNDHGGEASFIEIRHRLHLIDVTESELGAYDNNIKAAILKLTKLNYLRATLTGYKIGPNLTNNNYTVKAGSFVIDTEEDLND